VAGEVDADGNTADSKGMGVDGLFTDNCKTAVPTRGAWLAAAEWRVSITDARIDISLS